MSSAFTKSSFFRQSVHPFLSRLPFYDYYLLRQKSYLKKCGWFKSFYSGKSVDREGNPIPWFSYGAIEVLNERLPDDALVFEYGSGEGTKWWARRSLEVDAVEHDEDWYRLISKNLPGNVTLFRKDLGPEYESSITLMKKNYDVIIIDGKNRINCLENSLGFLTNRGIIIFDDTDRPHNRPAIEILSSKGFRHLTFRGFSPIEFMECETTFFYRDGNLLGI